MIVGNYYASANILISASLNICLFTLSRLIFNFNNSFSLRNFQRQLNELLALLNLLL